MIATTEAQPRYDLFMSYSRDPDYRLARALTGFLEAFHRTPVSAREGRAGPRLVPLQICLDGVTFSLPPEHGVGGAPTGERGVSPVLEAYLDRCEELLVLCSPQAARSPWVAREVDWWLTNRGPGSIRLAVTCGDDPWQDPASFFPAAVVAARLHASICYDLRGFDPKRARGARNVSDFDSERVRLAADLNGESAGDILPLWYRDQRRRQRRRAIIAGGAGAILLGSAAFALLQRQHGIEQSASRLVAESFELLERDPSAAMMKAIQARRLHDTTPARTAIDSAYRVLVFHARNRRESAQLTGSGPGYLGARWRVADLHSVFSDDGRYVVHATKRSAASAEVPGQVYLVDNETLRIIELVAPEDWGKRRVEFVGFDRENQHVFVLRQFYFAVFALDGSLVATYNFSRFTKSPTHLVDGYFHKRFVIGADGKGGLWMVDVSGATREHELQGEWHGDPLIFSRIDAEGRRAALVFESGRAALLSFPAPDAAPRLVDVVTQGALYAGFLGLDEMLIGGEDGLLDRWRVTGADEPERVRRYPDLGRSIEWVAASADGTMLLTTARDNTVTVLDADDGTVIAQLNRAGDIDWPPILRLPSQAGPPPGARALTVAGRKWLLSTEGAYVVENGRYIPVTERFRAVHDVVEAGGNTWVLSGAPPSTLLRVDGYVSYPAPRALGKVEQVLDLGDRALFGTTTGVWQFRDGRFDRVQGITLHVHSLRAIGGEIWAGTTRGLLWPGPAYRIDGLAATAYPGADARVSGIIGFEGAVWLITGGPVEHFGPAYRVVGGIARPVPGARTATRAIRIAGGALWLMTHSGGTGRVNGPAWRWDGQQARPLPSADAAVHALFEVGDEVWLNHDDGDGLARVTRYAGTTPTTYLLGDVWVAGIEKVAGAIWIATTAGAFRVDGETLSRFPDGELNVRRVVEREGDVWILSDHEAHRVSGRRTVRYATGEHPLSDVVRVNGVTWLLTKDIVTAGPAFRICGNVLVPHDPVARIDGVEAAGADTRLRLQMPDFRIESTVAPAASVACR